MAWTTSWPIIPASWLKENQWLKDLREQNEHESKLIKQAAERIADEKSSLLKSFGQQCNASPEEK